LGGSGVSGLWESVGEGYALVRYDRLGVGMSDRDVREEELTLEGEVALLRAVLDELALERVVLVGGSSGGCAAIAFAGRFPERVNRLLLYGAYADGSAITSPDPPMGRIAIAQDPQGAAFALYAGDLAP